MRKFNKYKAIEYRGIMVCVGTNGEIFANDKFKKHYINKDGYPVVSLYLKKIGNRYVSVARLMAIAYLPNPNHLKEVNHKDYNRQNYSIDNLEWISHEDNIRYSLCNKPDVTGKNNPNYGNHKLSSIYAQNKDLAKQKQSRAGIKNGRCRKIKMFKDNKFIGEFNYIKECCLYLIEHKIVKSSKIGSIRSQIDKSIRKNTKYKGYNFIKE